MKQRADGRFVKTKRIEGRKVFGYGASPEEAQADLDRKLFIPSTEEDTSIFHPFCKTYWYPMIENHAPLTVVKYRGLYKKWIKPYFESEQIADIKFPRVQAWQNQIKTDGCGDQTRRYLKTLLSGIFEIAVDLELMDRNPCKSKKIIVPKKTPRRVRVISLVKAIEVLQGVEGTDLSCPVFLALIGAMREGEVAARKWDDLDRINITLKVFTQLQHQTGKGVVEKPCKSDSARVLHLTKEIVAEIDRRGNLDSEYICTRNGERWTPHTIYEDWLKVRGKFGLDDWTFHDLRHGAGSLLEQVADLFAAQHALGHKNPNMTLTYVTKEKKAQLEGFEGLSRQLLTQSHPDYQNGSQ